VADCLELRVRRIDRRIDGDGGIARHPSSKQN
jgi:hypothetical protein